MQSIIWVVTLEKNKWRKKGEKFLKDERAVEGLPVRLIVVLVIGMVALSVMLGIMGELTPPRTIAAQVTQVNQQPGNLLRVDSDDVGGDKQWSCSVEVRDSGGYPVVGANVLIYGLGAAGSGITGEDGRITISQTNYVNLYSNQNRAYLTLEVDAPGYQAFSNSNAIVVVRVFSEGGW